jgi:low temperature requirement protein LtrA
MEALRKIFSRTPSLPVKKLLIAEEDVTHFTFAHPKQLQWFTSPLRTEEESRHHGLPYHHEDGTIGSKESTDNLQALESRRSSSAPSSHTANDEDDHLPGEPPLKRAHEASVIQLFYDLFFVANLTTFTSVHEISDKDSLKSYIGFFGMLWFTWLQVALFDVRFSNDSAFERLCKAMQFGIMTGFAVVGPSYKTAWKADREGTLALSAFSTLSLILMGSRILLAGQYAVILLWLRSYKKAWTPLLIHIGVLLGCAAVYLGLYFSINLQSGDSSLIAWYVTIGFEAGLILAISSRFRFLNFRKTNIVERLGLLTLIILGEGIIGLCKSVGKVGSDNVFTADVIGMIICSVAIIYFLWMLYFDQTEVDHVGSIRQLFWIVIHFPFHIAILLTVEGVSQLSVWRKVLNIVVPYDLNFTINVLQRAVAAFDTQTVEFAKAGVIKAANDTINSLSDKFAPSSGVPFPDISHYVQDYNATNGTSEDAAYALYEIFASGSKFVFDNFKLHAPENVDHHIPSDVLNGVYDTFSVVYVYFFIAAGCVLILLATLFILGKSHKVRADYFSIALRTLVGIALSLLATMDPNSNNEQLSQRGNNFLGSPWMLPTVVLTFGMVVLADQLVIGYVRRVLERKDSTCNMGEVTGAGIDAGLPTFEIPRAESPPAKHEG